ncbi:SDR family oxidoreductase [Acetobacter senegalensis]|uniref:SDR family oxidoreductase n=1 Tax=Acetobacter senegalensis TaxID=446692 RepID=UPI001EDA72E6|nr:SDR family oxidoreductase [Acetobacter senegalensis]MCG4261926.1 SDR family oxidoreductase [Acetobacter senegalensis]
MKTWFITGTSSGFGRIMVEKLLEKGDRVAATLRKPEMLEDLKQQYANQLWVEALDVTDTVRLRKVVDKAFADLSRIDVVVSNAGYAVFGAAEELTDDQIRREIDTNLIGSIQLTRAVLPYLRHQGGGRILQLSSMGGQISLPALSLYHATKWGIEGFFESVIAETAPFGIEITLVEPAGANTNFGHGSMDVSPPMNVYNETPAGMIRTARTNGGYQPTLDPKKAVQAMIDSVGLSPAPRRLLLGGQGYDLVHQALQERLTALEAQKDIAFAADYDTKTKESV